MSNDLRLVYFICKGKSKQAKKQASEETRRQISKQASKETSKQADKQLSNQTSKQEKKACKPVSK